MLKIRNLNRFQQVLSSPKVSNNKFKLNTSQFRSFSNIDDPSNKDKGENDVKKLSFIDRIFGVDSNTASKDFNNKWLMVAPAFITHMCIGAPYAWSLMADVVTREHGFVASAASDWTLMEAAFPLSMVFAVFGVSSSLIGKWQMKVGARKSMALGSLTFGGGLMMGAAGIYLHSLPLLYLGYGFFGGLGIGLSYTPPIQALFAWFPDKKGLASGMTIAGFGSGALLFAPCAQYLMKQFAKMPEYLGPVSQFVTKTLDGKLFAEVDGTFVEVVQAGVAELQKMHFSGLSEGLYIVNSGSTGAAEAVAVMGATYFAAMLAASTMLYKPHPSVVLAQQTASSLANSASAAPVAATQIDVSVDDAFRSKQFHLLGITFFCVATGGLGMFSVAKPMMNEVFSTLLPSLVTSAFAAKFVLMLSGGNLGGRIGWAAISDVVGRRLTFAAFTLGSIPLYCALPSLVDNVVTTGSSIPLYCFCASTVAAVSVMGGVYSILPAYESDLFGNKFVGAIHGKMLLYSAAASLTGPYLLINLRSISEKNVIADLLTKVSPENFYATFGAPIEQASELIAAKTLNISKLLALMPPGTIDPTPHIYDSTMYALSGLMAVAFLSHSMVRPLNHATLASAKAAASAVVIDVKESVVDVAAGVKEFKAGDRQVNK